MKNAIKNIINLAEQIAAEKHSIQMRLRNRAGLF
jgi:hypothetical protein